MFSMRNLAALGAAALALGLAGCPAARRPDVPAPTPAPAPAPAPAPPAPPAGTAHADAARADALAAIANRVRGVRGAWVVVSGDTAYVGLDVDGPRTPEANAALEREVARAIEQSPHGIRRAYVSTKPEVLQSIQNVAEGIRAGRPAAQFAAELAKLTAEMAPTTRP